MPPTSQPAWVVCTNTYDFWQHGITLPTELQLTPEAAAQIMRIKYWAAEQAALLEQEEAGGATVGDADQDDASLASPLPRLPCQGGRWPRGRAQR